MASQPGAEVGYKASMTVERIVGPDAVNKAMVFSRRLTPESVQAKMSQKLYEEGG